MIPNALPNAIRALAAIALIAASPAPAQEVEFGPGLRSLDFAEVFDTSVPARAQMWDAFHDAGIRHIVLSQGLVSPFAPDRSKRPAGTYIADRELADLRATLNRGAAPDDDFHVTYVGGYGLAPDVCRMRATPAEIGIAAAEWEFTRIVSRLLDAGLPVRTIDIDGPFLRVIDGARKGFSCALTSDSPAFDTTQSAEIVLSYMKHLRDLTDAHATNRAAGVNVGMTLLINLPNWRVGRYPPLASGAETGDLVAEILPAFGAAMRADTDRPLALDGAVIDYPYPLARDDTAAFIAKSEGLLAGLRALPRTRPRLAYFTNTHYRLTPSETDDRYRAYGGTVRCVWSENWRISGGSLPYLPYENANGAKMPADCIAQQNQADARYWDESALFANRILSGDWLGRTVTRADISAVRFMSWHEMPASSLSTMNRTLRFKLYGN
ncbi:hypothetical protein ACFORG_01250 [Lutimaribacter marinistellae]|uniref:Uncharacterized protein n=1 Tax=Lutimaribacter marinistellae TaxID=1820329 RepID=A0ABV7TCI3_9RHOB